MKTRFYQRSAYLLSDQPVPSCFVNLDDHFDERLSIVQLERPHPSVVLAESLCARFADVEMYAFMIEDARKRHGLEQGNDVKAAVLTRSFFVGYLGATRALLDVASVTLSVLYELPLPAVERTFAHGNFWHQLVTAEPNVHRRYHGMRLFFNEVLRWCNESAYRVPPLYVSHEQFGPYSSREMHLRLLDEAQLDLTQIPAEPLSLHWVDPLHLHDKWKPQFLLLCEKLCKDLTDRT